MASNTCVSSPLTECRGPAKFPDRTGASNHHHNTDRPQSTSNETQPLESWYDIYLQLQHLLQRPQPLDLSNEEWAMLHLLKEDMDNGLVGQSHRALEQRLNQLPRPMIRYLQEYNRYEHFVVVGPTTTTSQSQGNSQNHYSGAGNGNTTGMQYGG